MGNPEKDEKEKLHWKCSNCSYLVEEETPPEKCPSCFEKCTFRNVTCYRPECNFKGVDPKLK
jgi:rubrerythrin